MSNAQLKYISTEGMTKDEWLLHRKEGIGASEIGAVLGFNKYKTPYQVWEDKINRDIIPVIETPAMRRGKLMEDLVAQEYVAHTGNQIRRDNKIRIHPKYPFLFASLDRIIVDKGERGVGVLECKTVSSQTKKQWEEELPLSYYAQIQQQLAVTGYQWGEIALLVADTFDLTILPFEQDKDFIQQMIEIAEKFWNENVLKKISPPMELPDFELAFIKDELKQQATERVYLDCKTLYELKTQKNELEKKIKERENEIKEFLGTKTHLYYGDKLIVTWKTIERKGYTVAPTTYRKFDLKPTN